MHLRCELRGHEEDVRGLCVCPLGIISGSRDKTVRIWIESSESEFILEKTLLGHEDFVVPVMWLPPGVIEDFPNGTLAPGSKDRTVIIWNVDEAIIAYHLKGHTQQVTALGLLSDNTLVSASVDGTIRLWQKSVCTGVLTGHEGSVVSLLVLPEDHILSGSIDKTMRLWKNSECISVFAGHSDTVRGLALAPDLGLVSASHDKTLRLWAMDGTCLTEFHGHTEIVYCCAMAPNRKIASGSEDGTARIWDVDGSCLKSIYHPGNIWAIAFLPNNDLITACSDGIIRIFSEDENRLASPDVRQCFDAAVEARREDLLASRKGTLPPGMKIEDPSVLYMPGAKDGDTKIIAEGLGACAYVWSAADSEWKKIGDVLGTQPGELASASKFHDGREWDYVFDVDFEDGAPMKKLCLNKNDNPIEVAERFLIQENLPVAYRDQVVQFIMNNTQMSESLARNADPLTGGSAYQPSASSMPLSESLGAFGEASIMAQLKFSPMRNYLSFNVLKSAQMVGNKLKEFNDQIKAVTETENFALTDQELNELDNLLTKVQNIASGVNVVLAESDLELLTKLIKFPSDKIFPVLDICRILALNKSAERALITAIGDQFDGLIFYLINQYNVSPLGVLGTAMMSLGCHQLSLYLLTNGFLQYGLRSELSNAFLIALESFKASVTSQSKNVRIGFASFVLNLSAHLFMTGKVGPDSEKSQVIPFFINWDVLLVLGLLQSFGDIRTRSSGRWGVNI
eukprot:g2989.t1